jgi:hypothetical protein
MKHSVMEWRRHDLKILRSVVAFVPIDVMHVLTCGHQSTDLLGRQHTMLVCIATHVCQRVADTDTDQYVSV